MMVSPLQLDSHYVLEAAIQTNPRWVLEDENAPFNAVLQVRGETIQTIGEESVPYLRLDIETNLFEDSQDGATLSARAFLRLDVNAAEEDQEATPYLVHVLVYGEISAQGFPAEGDSARPEALQVVRANSASMLYGIAREVINTLTLHTPYRSLTLPSLSFQQVVAHEARLEAIAAEDTSTDEVGF